MIKKSIPKLNFPKILNLPKTNDEQQIIELIKLFFKFVKEVVEVIQAGGKKISQALKKPLMALIEKIILEYKIDPNEPLYQKFGLEMKPPKILENLVKIIQKKYIQINLMNLKQIVEFDKLEILSDLDFEFIFKNSLTKINALTELKIDFLLTSFNNPTHFDSKKVKEIFLINSFQEKTLFFHFHNDNSLLTKIASSDIAIEGYRKSLETQTNKKVNSEIKSKLHEILNQLKIIYVAPLPSEYMGVTLYSGKIFLNEKYYRIHHVFSQQKNAAILIIICHEILNILRRLIIDENFFNSTILFKRNSIEYLDLGDYFDNLLYGKFKMIYEKCAAFLMEIQNWNSQKKKLNFSEFKKNFRKILQNIPIKEKKRTGFLMKTFETTLAPFGAISIGFCGFHLGRVDSLLD